MVGSACGGVGEPAFERAGIEVEHDVAEPTGAVGVEPLDQRRVFSGRERATEASGEQVFQRSEGLLDALLDGLLGGLLRGLLAEVVGGFGKSAEEDLHHPKALLVLFVVVLGGILGDVFRDLVSHGVRP